MSKLGRCSHRWFSRWLRFIGSCINNCCDVSGHISWPHLLFPGLGGFLPFVWLCRHRVKILSARISSDQTNIRKKTNMYFLLSRRERRQVKDTSTTNLCLLFVLRTLRADEQICLCALVLVLRCIEALSESPQHKRVAGSQEEHREIGTPAQTHLI